MQYRLTEGSVLKNMLRFSLPYLLSCFLQTFYGLADLFITGRYNGADTLYPMGLAAPAGSLVSVIICLIMFLVLRKKQVF